MKKTYLAPQTLAYAYVAENMLAASLGYKDELGNDDQLSNERNSGWDTPEWVVNEE